MNRQLITAVSVWLLASVALGAATVWESKPFTAWTTKEAKQVVTNSPWSGKARVTTVFLRARTDSQQWQSMNPKTKETDSSSAHVGRVIWSSSPVVRSAQAHQQMLAAGGVVPADAHAAVNEDPDRYVVTVTISCRDIGSHICSPFFYAREATTIIKHTFLNREGKAAIVAEGASGTTLDKKGNVVVAPNGQSGLVRSTWCLPWRACVRHSDYTAVIVFSFPKIDPITAMDKEVEFVTRLPIIEYDRACDWETDFCGLILHHNVKKTFKLKDMTVKGELQL